MSSAFDTGLSNVKSISNLFSLFIFISTPYLRWFSTRVPYTGVYSTQSYRVFPFSSTINANWLYDTVNAIDDAGIAVSGVIVDGVNGVAYGATSLWEHTIGLC
jgi:hypothetical protein